MHFYTFFKHLAEEFSKFAFPVSKVVPAVLDCKNLYRIMLEMDGVKRMLKHFMRWHCDMLLEWSGLDNYSCWTKERTVRRYVKQSSNCKNIECTFAASESRREFIIMKSGQVGQGMQPTMCKRAVGRNTF